MGKGLKKAIRVADDMTEQQLAMIEDTVDTIECFDEEELYNRKPKNQSLMDIIGATNIDEYMDILDTDVVQSVNGIVNTGNEDAVHELKSRTNILMKVVYMTVQGYSNTNIAENLNLSLTELKMMKNSEDFASLQKIVTQKAVEVSRTFLTMGSLKAVKTLLGCLDSNNEKIKLAAATEVLNRVGLKQPEQLTIINKANELSSMSEEDLIKFITNGKDELATAINHKKV